MSATSGEAAPGDPCAVPRLHAVTDDELLRRAGWEEQAVEVLEAGGPELCLHVRGPRTPGAILHRLVEELLPHARRFGARLLVNDRIDVALTTRADGVHLGGRSLPAAVARELLGERRLVGRSCHDAACVAASHREGADYAFVGTIFPTPTHPDVAGQGIEGLAAAVRASPGFPVLGIGGIEAAGAADVLATGAYGMAVIRGVWEARDPAVAVRAYMKAIEETK